MSTFNGCFFFIFQEVIHLSVTTLKYDNDLEGVKNKCVADKYLVELIIKRL